MKYSYILLVIAGIMMAASANARQEPVPISDLLEITKWDPAKVNQVLKSKGFTYDNLSTLPNEMFMIARNFTLDLTWGGEHTAPSAYEDDPPFKRSFIYCTHYSRQADSCVFFMYHTGDYDEYESMLKFIEEQGRFLYDTEISAYSDGKFTFQLFDDRIKVNRMGTGNFIRRYTFMMIMPYRYIKEE